MTCEVIREQLVETARGRELSSDLRAIVFGHAAQCRECAAQLEVQQRLSGALSELALRTERPSRRVEELLLRKLPVPIGKKRVAIWEWAGAVAAVAALVLGFAWNQRAPKAAPAVQEAASDFVALPYAEETTPGEETDIVRVSMPGESLLAMGIPVSSEMLGEQVQADVEIGMDGTARAIRLAN